MTAVVSLSRARKARAKAQAVQTAAENRVRFGRTKAEKAFDAEQAARHAREAEGRRLPETDG